MVSRFQLQTISTSDVQLQDAAADCLYDAFEPDPFSQFFLSLLPPDPVFRRYVRLRNWRIWMRETPRVTATVWVAKPINPDTTALSPSESLVSSVAVWFPPGVESRHVVGTWWYFFRWTLTGWIYLFLKTFSFSYILKQRRERGRIFAKIGPFHESIMAGRPHYYLHFLATFKSWSGKGSASAVLQPILDVADKTGIECYLEAAGEKLIPFYEKFGFVKKGRIDVNGDNTIVLVPMVRLPKERK